MTRLTPQQRDEVAELLGEPLLTDDPMISVRQAAAVLDIRPERVRYLVRSGQLPVHDHPDGTRSHRRLRLSEVLEQRARPRLIRLTHAAAILGETTLTVRRLARVRLLTWHGRSWPLALDEVESLAIRRATWLTLRQAAQRTNSTIPHIRAMLDDGALTQTGDILRPVDSTELMDERE